MTFEQFLQEIMSFEKDSCLDKDQTAFEYRFANHKNSYDT